MVAEIIVMKLLVQFVNAQLLNNIELQTKKMKQPILEFGSHSESTKKIFIYFLYDLLHNISI